MIESRVADITEWHRLFDAVCLKRGHIDNGDLATAYCNLTRKKADGAYESALRSLNNWRRGAHVPNRRNARILILLLGLQDGDPVLAHWTRLYEEAHRRKRNTDPEDGESEDTPDGAPSVSAPPRRSQPWRMATSAVLALVVAGGAMIGGVAGSRRPWTPAARSPSLVP